MERIVLFDGICNFCNGAINFIIRHDREKKFRFAPLQSEFGEQMRAKFGIGEDIDSIVLIENEKAYLHSDAAFRIVKELGLPWSLGYPFIVLPAVVRDAFYKLFAKYRYKLFGKKDVCMVPTREVRERFLN
jgi:predicted DCC family thiol-disulfide oxidoreductase YuxK